MSSFGGSLHEHQSVLFRKLFTFFSANCSPVSEVALVADEHDGHIGVRMLPGILQPARQMVECLSPGDIINEQRPCRASVVRPRDRPERFLARRVPDLQLDGLVVDRDHASPEFDANSQIMDGLKPLVRELQQQARLPNTCVSDDDVLEEVRVRHGAQLGVARARLEIRGCARGTEVSE